MLNNSVNTELLLVDSNDLLDTLVLEKKPGLKDQQSYQWFLTRTKKGYEEYLASNPLADYRPYQYQHAAAMCCRRNNFMGWEMRSGKSLTTLLVIYGLYAEKLNQLRPKSIHIVVPSILASMSWQAELDRMPSFKDKFSLVTSDKELKQSTTPIIIYNYDFPKGKVRGRNRLRSKDLARLRPNLLVVDEIHGIKSRTQRTKQMSIVRRCSRRVLGLTGTPSEGTLTEVHTLMNFIYKQHWPYNKPEHFSKQFSTKQKLTANYLYGSNNTANAPDKYLQQLDANKMPAYYNLMQRFMHRLNISDPEVANCITVPGTKAIMTAVTPTERQVEWQRAYIAEHQLQLQRAANANTAQQRAQALLLVNPLIEIANQQEPNNKLTAVVDAVKAAKGKVVIYCNRVYSAWLVTQTLRSALGNDKVIRVYAQDDNEEPAQLSQEQRIDRVTAFQFDDNVKAGVFSINLASQAIELNQASDVIFYCMPWSSIQIRQAISRPVGPGNPHDQVNLHYLFHKGFIDEYQVMLAVSKIKSSRMLADYEVEYDGHEELTPVEAIRRLLS